MDPDSAYDLEPILRTPVEADWPGILAAAHTSAPWAGERNQEWLHHRQNFDDKAWRRRHYVLENRLTRHIVGYGAAEEGPEAGVFRVYVVMDAERLDNAGQHLYDRLEMDLKALNARGAWVREEARDTALLGFFARQQFKETRRAVLPDGMEVVRMEKRL